MTLVAAGVIRAFPVRYPPGIRSLDTLTSVPASGQLARRGIDPREIAFANSFGHARPQGGVDGHGAIDVYGAYECEVCATCDGTVAEAWTPGGERRPRPGTGYMPYAGDGNRGGNYVMIVDPLGYHHYFAHMARKSELRPGDPVQAGQVLGTIGATGLPPGRVQHLHYQVTRREGRLENHNPYQALRHLAERLGARVSIGGRAVLSPRG